MNLHTDTGSVGEGVAGARAPTPDAEAASAAAQVRTWLPFAWIAALAECVAAAYLLGLNVLMYARWGNAGGFLSEGRALLAVPLLAAALMFAGNRRALVGLRVDPARIPGGLRVFGLGALAIGVPILLAFAISAAEVVIGGRPGGFAMEPTELLLTAGFLLPLPVAVWGAILHYRHRAALGAAR